MKSLDLLKFNTSQIKSLLCKFCTTVILYATSQILFAQVLKAKAAA